MYVIIRKRLPYFGTTIAFLLVFMVMFPALPLATPPVANAGGWAGWSGINTIYYDPSQDDAANKFLDAAAQELKTYLGKISGRTWTIVQRDPGSISIRLLVNPTAPEFANRGDEAVHLVADSSGVRIIGKTPIAVRHGAYILLEKLGVRWFFKSPVWEVVPTSLVDTGTFDEVQEPFYFWRELSPGMVTDKDMSSLWGTRNRLFGAKHYYTFEAYQSIIPGATWSSESVTHPEWFLPEGGKPKKLRPDNPDVIAKAIQYARNLLSASPHKMGYWNDSTIYGSVSMTPSDGGGWSPPWDDSVVPPYGAWQTITDKVFYLANEVAKAVKNDFPDRYISLLSYDNYSGVPTFDLEPNLLVTIVTGYNYSPLTFLERIDGMLAKGVKVGIYDYFDVWDWWHDKPRLLLDRVNKIKWYAGKGIRMFTAESGDGWGGRGITYYVASKLLWNPDADVNAVLDDFYTKAFGPAKEPMKRYYENQDQSFSVSVDTLGYNFLKLKEAELLAAGDPKILERIRYLEYYQRFVWKWHLKGIDNLNTNELKDLYVFLNRTKNLYIVDYWIAEQDLRQKLQEIGLTNAQIDALKNTTLPTAAEATTWLNEALAAFGQPKLPVIDTSNLELVALGDTTKAELQPLFGAWREILIPSKGNEDITISVKGTSIGTEEFAWYNPYGIQVGSQTIQAAPDWTALKFHADIPGNYTLKTPRFPSQPYYVDVPDRPASMVALKKYDNNTYIGTTTNQIYFYVPKNTGSFSFGVGKTSEKAITGRLIDSKGNTTKSFSVTQATEFQFDSPAAGLWKIVINPTQGVTTIPIWLNGIPPLVWHDPRYLLVPKTGSK